MAVSEPTTKYAVPGAANAAENDVRNEVESKSTKTESSRTGVMGKILTTSQLRGFSGGLKAIVRLLAVPQMFS